jgi:uncharacterized membrane protein
MKMNSLYFALISISVCFYIQPKTDEDWIFGGNDNRLEDARLPSFTGQQNNDFDMKFDLDMVKQNDKLVVDNDKIQSAIENMFTQSFSKSLPKQENHNDEVDNMFTMSFSKTLKEDQVPIDKNDEINNMFTMSLSKSINGENSNRFNIDLPNSNDNIINTSDSVNLNINQMMPNNNSEFAIQANPKSVNPEFMNQFNSLYNDIIQMLMIKAQKEQNNKFLPVVEERPKIVEQIIVPSLPTSTSFLPVVEERHKIDEQIIVPSLPTPTSYNSQSSSDSNKYEELLKQFNNYK